jgi:uncharacterized protein (TIGR02246 family)
VQNDKYGLDRISVVNDLEVVSFERGKLEVLVRGVVNAFNRKDLEGMLSFFADDAIMVRPEGTFRGKDEIKRFYEWNFAGYLKNTLVEKDLVIEGDKVVLEFVSEATVVRGRKELKQHLPGMVMFVFKDGQVQQVHDYYNKLLSAQQLANGWFEKTIVNGVVKRMKRGLR